MNFAEDDLPEEQEEVVDETFGVWQIATPTGRRIPVTVEPGESGGIVATSEEYDDLYVEGTTVQEVLEEVRAQLVDYEIDGR